MTPSKVAAMTAYPASLAWMFGPTGLGAHIHVHWQIRATFSGTVTPGAIGTSGVNASELNAPATSATRAPLARYSAYSTPLNASEKSAAVCAVV